MKVTLSRAQIWQMGDFSRRYAAAHVEGTAQQQTADEWRESMGVDLKQLPLTFFGDGSCTLDFTPPEPPQVVDAEVVKEEKPKAKSKAKKNGKGGK